MQYGITWHYNDRGHSAAMSTIATFTLVKVTSTSPAQQVFCKTNYKL